MSPQRPEPGEAGILRLMFARGWPWIVAALAVIGVALVQLVTGPTSPMYESTGSYIVRSRGADAASNIQATANLNGTVRIDTTFARIAESELIVDRARESLQLAESGAQSTSAKVDVAVTPSANILSISARADEADVAQALATAVGTETVRYIQGLADLYDLSVLDPPSRARRSSPAVMLPGPLAAAGLVGLGIGTVTRPFVRRRLSAARDADSPLGLDTGVGNERYARQRFREERARTNSNGAPFHLLVIVADVAVHRLNIPGMAHAVSPELRDEDHLVHLREIEPRTFVAIVPGRADEEADQLAERVRGAAIRQLSRHFGPHAAASVHTCRYEGGAFHGDPEAIRIAEVL